MMREAERRIYRNRIRRMRQLRRRVTLTVAALCLSVVLGIIGSSFLSQAQEEIPVVSYKYFTSILVQPGDTLTSIACEYMDANYASVNAYIEEVSKINHIAGDRIYAGEYLVVPYYSTEYLSARP